MKRFLTLLIYLTVYFNEASTAIMPPVIDTHAIHLQCQDLLSDKRTLKFENHFFNCLVMLNDSLGYYNPVGTLHLFEIQFDSVPKVTLLRDAPFNGHNFKRHLFIYKENLYSFGGEGLFNTNSVLIKFDFLKKEWFKVKIAGFPFSANQVLASWLNGNKLFAYYKLPKESDEFLYGFIDLDNLSFQLLESNEISKLKSGELHKFLKGFYIHHGNTFSVIEIHGIEKECSYFLLNNSSGEFLQVSFLKGKPCINGRSYVYTKDSTIFYRYDNGSIDSTLVSETTVYKKYSIHASYQSLKYDSSKKIFLSVGIFLLGVLVLLVYYYRSAKTNVLVDKSNSLQFLDELAKRKGERVLVDELDELLKINHLSIETSKSMRSKMIKTLNETGKVKISRVRNETDKRIFDYIIE